MLQENHIEFEYREYTENPLTEPEIQALLRLLKVPAQTLLRKNDKAYKECALTGNEDERQLVALMAKHPTLLQRPIGILNEKAVVGRPHERLLELL